ncbi:MAG: helix-turn-helix transcriptional regulator [Acidobacteriota bacterium]
MSRHIHFTHDEQTAAAPESLSRFVRRILNERRLTFSDVELRAGGEITDGHVANILAGDSFNLRIQTLKALARGLGVAEERLVAIARGLSGDYEFKESDFIALFRRYETLSETDKVEVRAILNTMSREIERLSSQTKWQRLQDMMETSRPIALSRRESLGAYIRRLLDERGLSFKDVEMRSGERISHSYVHQIASGQTKNLTVEKIRGLAAGLGVTEEEVFKVVCDTASAERSAFRNGEFAGLYQKYEALSERGKRRIRPLVEMLDREIDWRNMLAIEASADATRKSMMLKKGRP